MTVFIFKSHFFLLPVHISQIWAIKTIPKTMLCELSIHNPSFNSQGMHDSKYHKATADMCVMTHWGESPSIVIRTWRCNAWRKRDNEYTQGHVTEENKHYQGLVRIPEVMFCMLSLPHLFIKSITFFLLRHQSKPIQPFIYSILQCKTWEISTMRNMRNVHRNICIKTLNTGQRRINQPFTTWISLTELF